MNSTIQLVVDAATLLVGGLPIGDSPSPTQDQLEAARARAAALPRERKTAGALSYCEYATPEPFFVAHGRRIAAFIDDEGVLSLPAGLIDGIRASSAMESFELYVSVIREMTTGARQAELLPGEWEALVEELERINETAPGFGVTAAQIRDSVSDVPKALSRQLLAWDLPGGSPRVFGSAVHALAKLRAREGLLDEPSPIERHLKDVDRQHPRPDPVKVLLVSFGTIWHSDVWNPVPIETLIGDLEGRYGAEVDWRVVRPRGPADFADTVATYEGFRPDIIGFSLTIGCLPDFEALFEALQEAEPEGREPIIALGNVLPTYVPEYFQSQEPFARNNFVMVNGDGEMSLRHLVEVARGAAKIGQTPNAIWWDDESGAWVDNGKAFSDLNVLVHPPHSMPEANGGGTSAIEASRGCLFECSFCSEGPGNVRRNLPVERVLLTIEALLARGICEFEFVDDEFFGGRGLRNRERVASILEGIDALSRKYEREIAYRIFTNPLVISERAGKGPIYDLLRMMKRTGLERVYLGVEAGSVAQRKRFQRPEKAEDCVLALERLRELDIAVDVGFIMFEPEMTIDDIEENIAFFEEHGLLAGNTWPFRPLTLTVGTPLAEKFKDRGYVTGPIEPNSLSMPYRFVLPEVGHIAETVQDIAQLSADVFYAVKYLTKRHWSPQGADVAHRLAGEFVRENAQIYLDMMSEMVRATRLGTTTAPAEARALARSRDLVTRVGDTVETFREHGYAVEELSRCIELAMERFGTFQPRSRAAQLEPTPRMQA